MAKGRIVAESTSPVGRGTAGLLLMNGMSSPFSGTKDGLVAGKIAIGAGLGEASWRGWNGHGNAGDDDTEPPELGRGAEIGDSSGERADSGGCSCGETFMASF